jgi:hypothetical protein
MSIHEYVLKKLSVGNGSIIGKDNLAEFFNHVSRNKDIKDRSLAELAPNYETVAYLVHMLEARFANLNPIIQQMFVKLHDVEDTEKREFILETLCKEFRDVVIEARKVFDRFNMLGSCVDVIGTLMSCKYSPLETPRGRYDEHSSKSSLSCETKVYRTSRRKPNFRR